MSKRILIAIDGSEHAFKALDFASKFAAHEDSAVILVHAIPEGGIPDGLQQWAEVEHVSGNREWLYEKWVADRLLASARERLQRQGVSKVECIVARGEPAKSILSLAEEHEVDVIALGTRGLSDIQGLLLGSVAHKVTHAAHCTVVTVR